MRAFGCQLSQLAGRITATSSTEQLIAVRPEAKLVGSVHFPRADTHGPRGPRNLPSPGHWAAR
eukprot:8304455-Pyramimonas_sp.AAC.1